MTWGKEECRHLGQAWFGYRLSGAGLWNLQNIRLLGQSQQLAGLPQADAMQGGQIIAAGEDAHVAELLLRKHVPQRAAPAKVVLVYFQAVAMFVHFKDHLQH